MFFRVGGEGEADAGGGEGGEEGDAAAVGEFVGGVGIRGAGRRGGRGMQGETGRCGRRGMAGGASWRGGRAVADGTAFAPRLFRVPPCGRVAMRSWRRDQADDLGEAEVADGFVAPDTRGEDFAGDEDELRADGERVFLAAAEEQAHAAANQGQGAAVALGEVREDGAQAQAVDAAAAVARIDGNAAAVLVVDGQDGGDVFVGREGAGARAAHRGTGRYGGGARAGRGRCGNGVGAGRLCGGGSARRRNRRDGWHRRRGRAGAGRRVGRGHAARDGGQRYGRRVRCPEGGGRAAGVPRGSEVCVWQDLGFVVIHGNLLYIKLKLTLWMIISSFLLQCNAARKVSGSGSGRYGAIRGLPSERGYTIIEEKVLAERSLYAKEILSDGPRVGARGKDGLLAARALARHRARRDVCPRGAGARGRL